MVFFFGNEFEKSTVNLMKSLLKLRIISVQTINPTMWPRGIGFEAYIDDFRKLYLCYFEFVHQLKLIDKQGYICKRYTIL